MVIYQCSGVICQRSLHFRTVSLFTQSIRCYAKPNIQRPQYPHKQRALFLELTRVQLPKLVDTNVCGHVLKKRFQKVEVEPLDQILAAELLEKLNTAKFMAILIRLPSTNQEFYDMQVLMSAAKLYYCYHSLAILKLAFTDTKYEKLLPLYDRETVTFVCHEDFDINKTLKTIKKVPGLVLIGGVVEGRMMHVADLQTYASLPPLDALHGELSAIISSPGQKLSSNITHHQTELSSSLTRFLSDKDESTSNPDENS